MSPYRTFIGESSSPAPSHEARPFDGIRFYKSFFPAGSHQTYRYHADIRYSDAPTIHIQTSGRIVEAAGLWPVHEGGWMSREDGFIIPAGDFTRLAESDAVRWCCLGRSDTEHVWYVSSSRIKDGSSIDLDAGRSILPLTGSMRCGDVLVPAETRARCVSGPKRLFAEGDVLAFVW